MARTSAKKTAKENKTAKDSKKRANVSFLGKTHVDKAPFCVVTYNPTLGMLRQEVMHRSADDKLLRCKNWHQTQC